MKINEVMSIQDKLMALYSVRVAIRPLSSLIINNIVETKNKVMNKTEEEFVETCYSIYFKNGKIREKF